MTIPKGNLEVEAIEKSRKPAKPGKHWLGAPSCFADDSTSDSHRGASRRWLISSASSPLVTPGTEAQGALMAMSRQMGP
jgi:hypothetical protein